MPRRQDLERILVIGSGPIVIGQACEFDYSGTQAIKALKEEGYYVILVNSNPATIMTDPELADVIYIEPISLPYLTKIIERERPQALLPTVGGQTALNAALELARAGVLREYSVELIGAKEEAIAKAEDRRLFKAAMDRLGFRMPKSGFAHSADEAEALLEEIGLPVILRPSFTLGGSGGGVCYNREDFPVMVKKALEESPIRQVLIDESIIGWKEYELEVMRDLKDNVVIICSIENLDPMGVHTGDSITVAPQQTLTDREYQKMRDMAIAIIREIGVETGGSNIQFAVNPQNGEIVVIEMNPRVSRSSALASKATGFPIAKIAAKLSVGYTLDEIWNDITRKTPACFEPTIDYIVTKIPRFTFEKFPETPRELDTQMRSVGEVMAIGRTFPESLQKAMRSLELGYSGWGADGHLEVILSVLREKKKENHLALLRQEIRTPTDRRLLYLREALREGFSLEEIYNLSHIDPWFLHHFQEIINFEEYFCHEYEKKGKLSRELLYQAKRRGFSDRQIAYLLHRKKISQMEEKLALLKKGTEEYLSLLDELEELLNEGEKRVRQRREEEKIFPVFKRVDTCAAEFESYTPYLYSTYEEEDESEPSEKRKVIILGGGPNRIGQGIEFDYCCCHAAFALKDLGIESIMVNSNPETVSTDYDTSDRLYFEPLTAEHIYEIYRREKSKGEVLGLVVQFGGQTPLRLAKSLAQLGMPILGTSIESIEICEDRQLFQQLLHKLGLRQSEGYMAASVEDAVRAAQKLGYPVLVRPSFVLGGRAMMIVHTEEQLRQYMQENTEVSLRRPALIDRFLQNALELDVDALSDGQTVTICGILEHVEEAGVHSGDSACLLPTVSIPQALLEQIQHATEKIALELKVRGFINIQYAIQDKQLYVLEVNPRASRTVPFLAKATGKPLVKYAMGVILGKTLRELGFTEMPKLNYYYAKEVVLPFKKFRGVDTILGPEMKSTGEVMGIGRTYSEAFFKSQIASGMKIPIHEGTIFVSVNDQAKEALSEVLGKIARNGFRLLATQGTCQYLKNQGIECERVNKVHEGRPHIVDLIRSGKISLIINIPTDYRTRHDALEIRLAALQYNLPYFTTVAAAREVILGILEMQNREIEVYPLKRIS
ncbi:MAG: carbamoyl-phosphate synthase large subunit [Leptospiraceae bacterium]|nr:carbamoyl-phosphate synthase large subunit [Leptospiraceae bacterium]MDW8305651.1 carbamoyl-phosphate synthase large subunit [Leptospiraceae bacterium]